MKLLLFLTLICGPVFASELGKVISPSPDSYLIRKEQKIPLSKDLALELNDKVYSEKEEVIIQIFPGTQIALAPDSIVTISENSLIESEGKLISDSVVDFIKGMIRVLVIKEDNQEINQRVRTEGVSFGVRGTEFEVSYEAQSDVDLDVIDGIVEASSPYIQTFVPEIIKKGEGLRFSKKQRSFAKRPFKSRFKKRPGFLKKAELKKDFGFTEKDYRERCDFRKKKA